MAIKCFKLKRQINDNGAVVDKYKDKFKQVEFVLDDDKIHTVNYKNE